MINGDSKVLLSPQLLALKILHDFVSNILEVLAVVRHADHQEPNGEDGLALRERRLALVKSAGRAYLPEARDETVEGTRGTGYDKRLGAVVERYADLRVVGEVLVRLRDMTLEVLERETSDGQHGTRATLASVDSVLYDARLESENRERLLSTETRVE